MMLKLKQLIGNFKAGGMKGAVNFFLAVFLAVWVRLFPTLGRKRHYCPCCGWRGPRFLPFIDVGYITFDAVCPVCRSHGRHRGHLHFYEKILKARELSGSLLYIAPESNVEYFRNIPELDVKTSEYGDAPADFHLDLCNIDQDDGGWDYIICHRVIEHLPDDRKGMMELYRILKPGGIAVISVPIDRTLDRTIEYGRPNPLETDHYYRYGLDFDERIPRDFEVLRYDFRENFTEENFREISLLDDYIFLCRKSE